MAIAAFEGDWVTVAGPTDAISLVADSLDRSAQLDADLATPIGPLLQRVFAGPAAASEASSELFGISQLVNLIALFDHARLELPDDEAPGVAALHPLFRALLHRRYVSAVEPLIRRVRRGYVETEEVLLTPRGRILDTSVVQYQFSGEPRLACRFDEYTEATPLLRVIVAALAEVVRSDLPPYAAPIVREPVATAVRLARHLSTIPVPDRAAAMRLSRQIRLTRLEAEWKPALVLAQRVLADAPLAQDVAGDVTQTLQFDVATDRVWERILEQGLRRALPYGAVTVGAGKAAVGEAEVDPPWKGVSGGAGSRFPDFLVSSTDDAVWCIDAKYKLMDGNPEEADANQVFVYSHLARRLGAPVAHCALIYPIASGGSTDLRALLRLPDEGVDLRVAHVSFPSDADIVSPSAWTSYISKLERELVSIIGFP